jgi:hypothetical protein
MRIDASRFKECSEGREPAAVSSDKPETLKLLEQAPALLMYEAGVAAPQTDCVRYGALRGIAIVGKDVTFRFQEEGQFTRADVREFADRLGMGRWEENRTHWAVKDGSLPSAMLSRLVPTFDVVLSFAGEDRPYVAKVASFLRSKGVRVFYDVDEEAQLWGKDLSEHLDMIYRRSGHYCVVFISEHYARKMWTRHERRSALARAISENAEYVLPARFDDTDIHGISPSVAYVSASDKTPTQLGKVLLKKLGRLQPG